MWKIIQEALFWTIAVLFLSQIIVPMITGWKMFWLFRKNNKQEPPAPKPDIPLDNKILAAGILAKKTDETLDEIDDEINKRQNELSDVKEKVNKIKNK